MKYYTNILNDKSKEDSYKTRAKIYFDVKRKHYLQLNSFQKIQCITYENIIGNNEEKIIQKLKEISGGSARNFDLTSQFSLYLIDIEKPYNKIKLKPKDNIIDYISINKSFIRTLFICMLPKEGRKARTKLRVENKEQFNFVVDRPYDSDIVVYNNSSGNKDLIIKNKEIYFYKKEVGNFVRLYASLTKNEFKINTESDKVQININRIDRISRGPKDSLKCGLDGKITPNYLIIIKIGDVNVILGFKTVDSYLSWSKKLEEVYLQCKNNALNKKYSDYIIKLRESNLKRILCVIDSCFNSEKIVNNTTIQGFFFNFLADKLTKDILENYVEFKKLIKKGDFLLSLMCFKKLNTFTNNEKMYFENEYKNSKSYLINLKMRVDISECVSKFGVGLRELDKISMGINKGIADLNKNSLNNKQDFSELLSGILISKVRLDVVDLLY